MMPEQPDAGASRICSVGYPKVDLVVVGLPLKWLQFHLRRPFHAQFVRCSELT